MKKWTGEIKPQFVKLPLDLHKAMRARGLGEGKDTGEIYTEALTEFLERKTVTDSSSSATAGTSPSLKSGTFHPTVHDIEIALSSTGILAQLTDLERQLLEFTYRIIRCDHPGLREALRSNIIQFHDYLEVLNERLGNANQGIPATTPKERTAGDRTGSDPLVELTRGITQSLQGSQRAGGDKQGEKTRRDGATRKRGKG